MNLRANPGVVAALSSALLFGAAVPLSKVLLHETSSWLLAGILYLGSGIGLAIVYNIRGPMTLKFEPGDIVWLAATVICGGIIAPVLLMWGLTKTPAATASLLLNGEGVLTVLIAWFVFRENFDRRIAVGMVCIVAGTVLLAAPHGEIAGVTSNGTLPALAIIAACLAWAIDNNLTRKISLSDANFIAMVKGLVAGLTNITIAFAVGAHMPMIGTLLAGGTIGFFCYGVSLVLFVLALRYLGTARTSAYFSTAPFVGALIAVLFLGESMTMTLVLAAALMAIGLWLHFSEHHLHEHTHEALEHAHEHIHDAHHQHEHDLPVSADASHSHSHRHSATTHTHEHYPDAHHTHKHR